MSTNNAVNIQGPITLFYAYNTVAQTIKSGGSPATVVFSSELYDTTNSFNTASYTFSAPISGYYLFNVCIWIEGAEQSTNSCILVTTSQTYNIAQFTNPSNLLAAERSTLSGSCLCYMSSSDTAYVQCSSDNALAGMETLPGNNQPSFSGSLLFTV